MNDKSVRIFAKWVLKLLIANQHVYSEEERSKILEQIEDAALDMGLAEYDENTQEIVEVSF